MSSEPASTGEAPGAFISLRDGSVRDGDLRVREYRRRLRSVLSGEEDSSARLQAVLNLGTEWFGVEHGHLARIDPAAGTRTVVEESGAAPRTAMGETTVLSRTYCRHVVLQGQSLAVENALEQGWRGDPAFEEFRWSTYLGARLIVGGELYGTVAFADRDPRSEGFTTIDKKILALIGEIIEQELGQNSRWPLLGEADQLEALFAASSDLIHVHDAEGNIRFPNPRLSEKTGYKKNELTEMKVWEIDRKRDREAIQALLGKLDPGDRCTTEGRYREKEGTTFPVKVTHCCLEVGGDTYFLAVAKDVSDQKERERELLEERERFESFVQEVEEYAIFRLDPEGRVQTWNEGAERIKGYEASEILGTSFSTFYTEEDREAGVPEENLRRAAAEGSIQDEGWRVRQDGSRFWANVTITALWTEEGELRGFTKVTRDMTNRRKRERRYEAIFNQTYQFIGLMEPDGTLIEANDTALQFGDLDREDVVGKPFWETYWWQINEETQEELREAIDRAADGEFIRYDVEVQGGYENIVIDFSIRPVRNERGEVTLLIPEGRNITELKALKERKRQLEEARTLLAQAQRLADIAGWKIEVRGEPPYEPVWTDRFFELFDIPSDHSPSLEEVLDLFPAEAQEEGKDAIERALDAGESWDREWRLGAEGDPERWIRSIGKPVFEDGQIVALHGAFQDVTERKEREKQLEQQNERLDQFASLISHDLRSPMHVAKGRIDLARTSGDLAHLDEAGDAIDRMDAIVEDLLTLTWGGQEIDSEDLRSHHLIGVAKESWGHVDTADATLEVEDDCALRADESRLGRLFENLFRNAVEHGGKDVTVTVGGLPNGFYVEDDGPGIPEDEREKVLKGGYSSSEEGTGLGLSIAQAIAETHGWEMHVTESEAGGARFEITAPTEHTEQK